MALQSMRGARNREHAVAVTCQVWHHPSLRLLNKCVGRRSFVAESRSSYMIVLLVHELNLAMHTGPG
jgi:hypothetical protein